MPDARHQTQASPQKTLVSRFVKWLESGFVPEHDLGCVSREHLVDLNATAKRNRWFDSKGNPWPLRDSI